MNDCSYVYDNIYVWIVNRYLKNFLFPYYLIFYLHPLRHFYKINNFRTQCFSKYYWQQKLCNCLSLKIYGIAEVQSKNKETADISPAVPI